MSTDPLTRAPLSRQIAIVAMAVLPLFVGGCDRDRRPSGQVVATVNDDTITTSDLQLELAAVPAEQRRAAQSLAVQSLVDRQVLVQYAKSQALDRRPEYILQLRRLTDALLAQHAAQQITARATSPVSLNEVNRYLDTHPYVAASRRRLKVQQLQFPFPSADAIAELNRAKSLEEVRALLQRRGITPVAGQATLDTAVLPDNVARSFDRLQLGEPLIVLDRPRSTANIIVESTPDPLSGETAERIVRARIQAERTKSALQQRGMALRGAAKIVYAKGYDPAVASPR